MSKPTAGKNGRNAKVPARPKYDKELVRERTLELLARRLGPGKDQGARVVWDCPECGKREKYSVKRAEGKGGCLVEGCRLGGYDDAFGMLAKLELLDYHADFIAVLRRAYDLLGLEPAEGGHPSRGAGAPDRRPPRAPSTLAVSAPPKERQTEPATTDSAPPDSGRLLELAASVYERILSLCPLQSRDRAYLRTRGLSNETISKGCFGTMTAPRARNVKAKLQREFGREALLSVPGFSEDEKDGRLKFTLTGEYILIPYHGPGGRLTTIEGRCIGEPSDGLGKYVSLRGSGNHLYLFPGHKPERLLAVCEGAMGAIVAAEFGLAVGAIQGCERFRASPSPEMLDGSPGDPLMELKGADFGGRTVPYIPDADFPPNPNVLRAAPRAARWIAEPQNGTAAICLLPKGADLDEWLLSLDPAEIEARFAELLAAAHPPEDGEGLSTPVRGSADLSPKRRLADGRAQQGASPKDRGRVDGRSSESPPDSRRRPAGPGGAAAPNNAGRAGSRPADSRVLTPEDVAPREAKTKTKGSSGRAAKRKAGNTEADGPQPGLWDEVGASGGAKPGAGDAVADRREASRGARKLRDEVYRAMMEALPMSEKHLRALEEKGVIRATARVGGFSSVDARAQEKVAAALTERFGAKKLLAVPGFEADAVGKVRLSVTSREATEHLLIPCFDAEGMLSAVEGLPFDPKTGELDAEQTVPLSGAGSHLYVFAHYPPAQIEGFCEGPLGAMLAAQEDVVIGATGGFRRYKAASGPGEGRQPLEAVLPELEGVDFGGRQLAYCPRGGAGVPDANARYHEAVPAARWLVERQNGHAAVVDLDGERSAGDGSGADSSSHPHAPPTSLAQWIAALPEEEARDRLRDLFPESPLREVGADEQTGRRSAAGTREEAGEESPPPPPAVAAYAAVGAGALLGVVVDLLLARLDAFAGYVSPGPGGTQLLYAGALGPLRRLADSGPFHLLYDYHTVAAGALAFGLALVLIGSTRRAHLARWRAARMRLEDRWTLHMSEGTKPPSRAPLTAGEVLAAALAWPIAYVLFGWVVALVQWGLLAAASLRLAPEMGPLVADPKQASLYAACAAAAFVLWRRRAIRGARSRMLRGKIRY